MTKTIRIRKLIAAVALTAGAGLAIAGPASADDATGLAYSDTTMSRDFDPSRYDYASLEAAGCIDAYGNIDQACAEAHGTEVEDDESSTLSEAAPHDVGGGWDEYGVGGSGSGAGYGSSAGSGVNLSAVPRDARVVLDWVL